MSYDEKLCDEKHKNIKETLNDHKNRLNGHSARLDKLEQGQSEFKVEIKNLCNNLKNLTNILK